MIAYINGTIKLKRDNFIVVETNGVGYKVFVTEQIILNGKVGANIKLYTYQHVREDALQLFGFATYDQLALFEKLISVSGVGPKTGLAVFSVANVADIKSAIIHGDATILKKVSGIGTKTAERIVLELKNKIDGIIGESGIKSGEELSSDGDVVDALVSLGFSAKQAQGALQEIDRDIKDASAKVKAALKVLNG